MRKWEVRKWEVRCNLPDSRVSGSIALLYDVISANACGACGGRPVARERYMRVAMYPDSREGGQGRCVYDMDICALLCMVRSAGLG